MNKTESTNKTKESNAERLVKEMMQRNGDGKANQQILDYYRKNRRR